MAKMTYEEAIAFMEQHSIYCQTGTRPDWHTNELPLKPVFWIRLAEYMNKKEEAERVLNAEMQKIVREMLTCFGVIAIEVEVRNGEVVSVWPIRAEQPDADEPDLSRIRPVGGIQ